LALDLANKSATDRQGWCNFVLDKTKGFGVPGVESYTAFSLSFSPCQSPRANAIFLMTDKLGGFQAGELCFSGLNAGPVGAYALSLFFYVQGVPVPSLGQQEPASRLGPSPPFPSSSLPVVDQQGPLRE